MSAFPEFFGEGDETMFGWFHPAASGNDRGTAVVLCPTLGFDQTCSYPNWRTLAERLAAAGFGVLRFDYLGTGDSAEDVPGSPAVARWQRSIALAVAHARRRSGAERVALLGLRLGGTLAACAAPDIPGVDSIVLWCPFRSGKQYVREMAALARLSQDQPNAEPGQVEAAGFLTSSDTIDQLSGLDIAALLTRPARRLLLIEREGFSSDSRMVNHLTHLGSAVSLHRTAEAVGGSTRESALKVPEALFGGIVGWLSEGHPKLVNRTAVSVNDRRAIGRGNGWRDEAINFGPGNCLFGILTRPDTARLFQTVVVFLNTGSEHHVGPHGMYVPLARSWAREGYASFRFDIGGIGDSRAPAGASENEAYPPHAMEDISAALAEVRSRTRARRLVVIGICSGGWHAFLAARDGLPIDGIIAINPPLYLREGSRYDVQDLVEQKELRRYGRSITDPEKWKKALRGQAGVATFVRLAATGAFRWLLGQPAALIAHSNGNNLDDDLRAIAARRVPAKFVFSESDLALTYFQQHAQGPARRPGGPLTWTIIDGADHTFGPLPSQRTLRQLMMEFLENGLPAS